MQFRFVSIEKLPEPPQIHLVKGNFVHRVLELLLTHQPELRTPQAALDAFDITKNQYEASPKFVALALSDDARDAFFKDSREILKGYYRMENPRNAKVIGLELKIEADFGKFVLKGIIDRLEYDENDQLVISDYKTGKTPSAKFGASKMDNMHLYASLCLRVRGELPKRLRLMYLKSSTPIEVEVTTQSNLKCETAALQTYDEIAKSCSSGIFATKKSGLCNFCAFKQWCPEFGGDDSKAKIEAPNLYPMFPRD